MTPRFCHHFSKFDLVFFVLNEVSSGNFKTMESWEIILAILSLKPRSHVRIKIYRTVAVTEDVL